MLLCRICMYIYIRMLLLCDEKNLNINNMCTYVVYVFAANRIPTHIWSGTAYHWHSKFEVLLNTNVYKHKYINCK